MNTLAELETAEESHVLSQQPLDPESDSAARKWCWKAVPQRRDAEGAKELREKRANPKISK